MTTLKSSDVALCLERTDPTHPPSFYNALEVVKRYARAKIAKGKKRHLASKGGKLEWLEGKFTHQGHQDIFYLTRLHLRLAPSTLDLPSPSCTVRKTLIKAGYPLSPQCECGNAKPERNMSSAAMQVDILASSPGSCVGPGSDPISLGTDQRSSHSPSRAPLRLRSSADGSFSGIAERSGGPSVVSGIRRSSSSRPDLPSTRENKLPSAPANFGPPSSSSSSSSSSSPLSPIMKSRPFHSMSTARSSSSFTPRSSGSVGIGAGSGPTSPNPISASGSSAKSSISSTSKWTPLFSGLGLKIFDSHNHAHTHVHPEPSCPCLSHPQPISASPEVVFSIDPFSQPLLNPSHPETHGTSNLTRPLDPRSIPWSEASITVDGESYEAYDPVTALTYVDTRAATRLRTSANPPSSRDSLEITLNSTGRPCAKGDNDTGSQKGHFEYSLMEALSLVESNLGTRPVLG